MNYLIHIPRRKRSGVALIVVLFCLVLLAVVTLALFSSLQTESSASKAQAEGQRAQSISLTALSLVMAQIRDATLETGTIWTSQPGALKTFGGNKQLQNVYKLYSSNVLKQSGTSYSAAADVPSDWQTRPAEFVDINRLDERTGSYPILDPAAAGEVDGFSLSAGTDAKMPVLWLYVLKDGSVAPLDAVTDTNPAVARLAFWTDDETCKLNLNTASEGSFWTPPVVPASDGTGQAMRAISTMRALSQKQPMQWEYQRYPGHPATTSLSPVLWRYFGKTTSYASATETEKRDFREALLQQLPRTKEGGSQGGNVGHSNLASPLALKDERLLSSVDEFLFRPSRSRGTDSNPARLKALKFFLTTSSRSPDTNPFKKPKLSMWPIHANDGDDYRTPFDRLSAFSASTGGFPFYFTRSDPYSRSADLPFASNSNHRNVVLYNYLQRASETVVPGYNGTFKDKYPDDYQQILTQFFDYIRCTNLSDRSTSPPIANPFTPRISLNVNDAMTSRNMQILGAGQVVPIKGPGNTMGFGRFATIARVGFVIFSEWKDPSNQTLGKQLRLLLLAQPVNVQHGFSMINSDYRVSLETLSPLRFRWDNPNTEQTFVLDTAGTPLFNYVQATDYTDGGSPTGGPEGFMLTLKTLGIGNKTAAKSINRVNYPFFSDPIDIPAGATTLSFLGGTVKLEVQAKRDAATDSFSTTSTDFESVQNLQFAFDPFGPVVLPQPGTFGLLSSPTSWPASLQNRVNNFGSRRRVEASHQQAGIFDTAYGDVVRNVTLNHGDYRLTAARPQVLGAGASQFVPEGAGYSGATPIVGSIRGNSWGVNQNEIAAGDYGVLVNGMPTRPFQPVAFAPAGMTDALNADGASGDFDAAVGVRAVGGQFTGPFINKPDDGSAWDGEGVHFPYMQGSAQMPPNVTFSSPSRQISSPVQFGSLPSGVISGRRWETLLFCPNPASRFGTSVHAHRGESSPPDHLWLEFFHMPVVEPYAITDPGSTAGKVNMNYQILPFTNIRRATALHGVMRSTKITAVPAPAAYADTRRDVLYDINVDATLNGTWTSSNPNLTSFEGRFASPTTAFLYPSEICEVPLVPQVRSDNWSASSWNGNYDDFWVTNRFTADNLREQPYAQIYPRLTTRSNTFTVHVMVQALSPAFTKTPSMREGEKAVTAEYRGSYTFERYLDFAGPAPDFADVSAGNVESFYKFRILANDSL